MGNTLCCSSTNQQDISLIGENYNKSKSAETNKNLGIKNDYLTSE
jgi:hypothetical protein